MEHLRWLFFNPDNDLLSTCRGPSSTFVHNLFICARTLYQGLIHLRSCRFILGLCTNWSWIKSYLSNPRWYHNTHRISIFAVKLSSVCNSELHIHISTSNKMWNTSHMILRFHRRIRCNHVSFLISLARTVINCFHASMQFQSLQSEILVTWDVHSVAPLHHKKIKNKNVTPFSTRLSLFLGTQIHYSRYCTY